jgi:wyosine [tRNA(Phe)-imidazoG37] synthetase (radical SAM superfamily)
MNTFLFDKIVFGPVKSRRLGISLGINLLPTECKICNFNCIYCECGWNNSDEMKAHKLPSRYDVYQALENKLEEMQEADEKPDVITFAGNGEPTLHPEFPKIVDDTIKLRNEYFPSTQISVLSNSTMLHKRGVIEALQKVDQNILKLDSAIPSTIKLLNQPVKKMDLTQLFDNFKLFQGKLIIQTLFTKGNYNGVWVDNTSESELRAWEKAIIEIAPTKVMIYSIDRNTPLSVLQKVPFAELNEIAQRIRQKGITVQVAD